MNRKWPISSGANAICGQAAICAGGPGLQMIVRYSVIVPVYLPVHHGFEADSSTLYSRRSTRPPLVLPGEYATG